MPSFLFLRRILPACLALLALLMTGPAAAQTLAQRWLKTYVNTASGRSDSAKLMEVGPDGHIVISGPSLITSFSHYEEIRTAKYHAGNGDLLWEKKSGPTVAFTSDTVNGLALDSAGNAIVAGRRVDSFYAAKYSAVDGALLWEKVFPSGALGYFDAVKVDAQDNVIITGTYRTESVSPIPSNIYTYKLAGATGDPLWLNVFDAVPSSLHSTDSAKDLALDANGDAFVTGYASFGQFEECVTRKISGADGSTLWTKQRRDNGTSGSSGDAIALDSAGNCFVAIGTPQGFGGLRVVKYRGSDGTELWVNVQDGPQRDEPSDIAIDPAGNAVVTGATYDTTRHYDIFTRRINGAGGQTIWTKTYDGGITSAGLTRNDRGIAVRFDRHGNAVVAGSSNNASGNGPDPMIIKYAPADGTPVILQRIAIGTGDAYPGSKDALVVGAGHVTVSGSSYSREGRNAFILRLNDPAPPTVITFSATNVAGGSATLNGSINPNGSSTSIRFEYGTSPASLPNVTQGMIAANGFTTLFRSATLTGLSSGTTYYYRLRADSGGQSYFGATLSFSMPGNNARLASAGLDPAELLPAFDPAVTEYITTVPFTTGGLLVDPVTQDPAATVKVNGTTPGPNGVAVTLPVGTSTISIDVTAEDGIATMSYLVKITRLPEEFVFHSEDDVPLSVQAFTTGNFPAVIRLEHIPRPGTALTMVENLGRAFIAGRFSNLAQGQRVTLEYAGAQYDFVANYYGGSGNDLVLHWAGTALAGWGAADQGQLGNPAERADVPAPVILDPGALSAGRTALATATGYLHGLCLFSDGKIAAWGYNVYGQAGQAPASPAAVPAGPVTTGALTGKTVIAIAAGAFHSLALCEDGTVAAWGYNNHGQLGNGTTQSSANPVAVDAAGALAGKTVVAIAAGAYHSLALCSDGTVAAWGFNGTGCLGNGSTTGSKVPVTTAALPGATKATAIAAGDYHSLALGDDGKVAAWGYNTRGQLGDGSTVARSSPVAVVSSGALAGKTVVAISSGALHALALCSDGTLAAWGAAGRCGTGEWSGDHPLPVQVQLPAGTVGAIEEISGGAEHSHARLKDGRVLFWGFDSRGQAGNGPSSHELLPILLPAQPVAAFTSLSCGPSSLHLLAIVPGGNAASGATAGAAPHEQQWWLEHFGSTGQAGDERDLDDPDADGLPNLVEYAFSHDPHESSVGSMPRWHREGDEMVLRFTAPEGVSGVKYGVVAADRPDADTWQEVANIGIAPEYHFRVPIQSARRFMRLVVTRG